MGEKFRVGEIVEMGGVIAHAVFESSNEVAMAGDVTIFGVDGGLGLVLVGGWQGLR
jgi:hypothetical protein